MSFVFTITLAPENALSHEDLRRWHPTDSQIELHLSKSMFPKQSTVLSVEKRGQGSQGLLTDNADPETKFWDIKSDLLPDLVKMLKVLRENTKSCFTLEAYWFGKRSSEQVRISIEELARLVEQGKIGTRANFLVC